MQARDPHVVKTRHVAAHVLGGQRRLLRHGHVAAARGDDGDAPAMVGRPAPQPGETRHAVVNGIRKLRGDHDVLLGRDAREQHVLGAPRKRAGDGPKLLVALAGTVDDLGESGARRTVRVQLHLLPQPAEGPFRRRPKRAVVPNHPISLPAVPMLIHTENPSP